MTPVVPNFEKRNGLIIAIVQDATTKQILMQAYMNDQAWHRTLARGEVVLWSTSRDELWYKGATSGNVLTVKDITLDCDCDAAVFSVEIQGDGNACHMQMVSCFHNHVDFSPTPKKYCPDCLERDGKQITLKRSTSGEVRHVRDFSWQRDDIPLLRCPVLECGYYEGL